MSGILPSSLCGWSHFFPPNTPLSQLLPLSTFDSWRNQGSEKLSHLTMLCTWWLAELVLKIRAIWNLHVSIIPHLEAWSPHTPLHLCAETDTAQQALSHHLNPHLLTVHLLTSVALPSMATSPKTAAFAVTWLVIPCSQSISKVPRHSQSSNLSQSFLFQGVRRQQSFCTAVVYGRNFLLLVFLPSVGFTPPFCVILSRSLHLYES